MRTHEGAIHSLMYVSRSLINGDIGKLEALRQDCIRRNAAANVTGALYYDNDTFIQILEGSREDVTAVAEHITRDERHTDMRTLWELDLPNRMFGAWSMKFVSGISSPELSKKFLIKQLLSGDIDYLHECANLLRQA